MNDMQEPVLSCPHCQHRYRLELTVSPKPTTNGDHPACYFNLRVQPALEAPGTHSTSETSFDESSQNSRAPSRTGSVSPMPQQSKNAISVPPEGVMSNPRLFDEPSEKSNSKSPTVKTKSSSKLRNLLLSPSAAGLPELNKDAKNSISVPREGVTSNPSLFDGPGERSKSKSKSPVGKPSRMADQSAGTTSNNLDETGEVPVSPSKKASRSIESSNKSQELPTTTAGAAAKPIPSSGGDHQSMSKSEDHST